jgi:WD40 repeat protein
MVRNRWPERHQNLITSIVYSADGSLLVTAAADDTVRVWDTETRESITLLPTYRRVMSLLFSPHGSYLYGSGEGFLRRWGGVVPMFPPKRSRDTNR